MKVTGWPHSVKRGVFLSSELMNTLVGHANSTEVQMEAARARGSGLEQNTLRVFLSHSGAMEERVAQVLALLRMHNPTVHVDLHDPGVPVLKNNSVALSLRRRMQAADKFIWLMNEETLRSPWQHWMLGWADAAKETMAIAIVPLFEGYEAGAVPYLMNYHRMVFDANGGLGKGAVAVIGPDDLHMSLERWLVR